MTDREEALIILQNCLDYENGEKCIYPIFPIERYEKVLKTAIEALKERPHGEWIPCSERLPEENKTVMASTNCGVFPEAKYTKEYGWEWAYESGADYWVELEDVTAWMPLPKPYKEEGDGNDGT